MRNKFPKTSALIVGFITVSGLSDAQAVCECECTTELVNYNYSRPQTWTPEHEDVSDQEHCLNICVATVERENLIKHHTTPFRLRLLTAKCE